MSCGETGHGRMPAGLPLPGDGILYYLNNTGSPGNRTLDALDSMCITARNIVGGKDLWSFTLPVVNATTVVIDDRNVYDYFGNIPTGNGMTFADRIAHSNLVNCTMTCPGQSLEDAPVTVKSWMDDVRLYPGKDVIYASLYTMSCATRCGSTCRGASTPAAFTRWIGTARSCGPGPSTASSGWRRSRATRYITAQATVSPARRRTSLRA